MLQHRIIQFPLYILSSGRLWEIKSKGKFQTFGSVSGHGRLIGLVGYKKLFWETGLSGNVAAYKRWSQ